MIYYKLWSSPISGGGSPDCTVPASKPSVHGLNWVCWNGTLEQLADYREQLLARGEHNYSAIVLNDPITTACTPYFGTDNQMPGVVTEFSWTAVKLLKYFAEIRAARTLKEKYKYTIVKFKVKRVPLVVHRKKLAKKREERGGRALELHL